MKPTVIATILAASLAGPATAQEYRFVTLAEVPVGQEHAAQNLVEASGITVDATGNLYVVEFGRHAIRRVTPAGEVTTFAGRVDVRGSTDGKLVDARFHAGLAGLGVAADQRGNLFVADGGNHTIRKISADGTVTTVAGLAGVSGSVDGVGSAARFASPSGIAVDLAGHVLVADFENHTVRKVTPDGAVTTLAGLAGTPGSSDGTGQGARFHSPAGIAVDRDGNTYVASYDNTVRKISSRGEVTTLAGRAGERGLADGNGSEARFTFTIPGFDSLQGFSIGLTVDGAGNLWVVDLGNRVIRQITPAGTVTTHGRSAQFGYLTGIAADATDNLYVVESGEISRVLKGVRETTFTVVASPAAQTVARGSAAVFTVEANGSGLSYRWTKDGVALSNATTSRLMINGAETADAGTYAWRVTDATGARAGGEVGLAVVSSENAGRLAKFSIRSVVGYRGNTLLVGATIAGAAADPMPVLMRAAGLSLIRFGPWGYIRDPVLALWRDGNVVLRNDDWLGDAQVVARAQELGAFPFYSADSGDAAIATALSSGSYLMEVAAKGDAVGDAMAEWYDATPEPERSRSSPRFVNLSTRKHVDYEGGVFLTAGFAIKGNTAKTVLLRAVGPSLAQVGVAASVADPVLQLFAGPRLIRENDDWGGDPQVAEVSRSVGAFALASAASKDAVLLTTLAPGEYTLQVRSRTNGPGGLILGEIFEVP